MSTHIATTPERRLNAQGREIQGHPRWTSLDHTLKHRLVTSSGEWLGPV